MDIKLKYFSEIDLSDTFFETLKNDYKEFQTWFEKKKLDKSKALVMESENGIEAFLYLKREKEAVTDVVPILPEKERLKIGTFKVNPHGTRLGERFIKKIFDYCISLGIKEAYVTIFPKHDYLVILLKRYGFSEAGVKSTNNGDEIVLLKKFVYDGESIVKDYPLFSVEGKKKYLLAIYPIYHTRLFPDSILDNEHFDIIKDVSHTNSIHKIYVCTMNVSVLKPKDLLVIYRTSDGKAPAHYRSVITSICVVEQIRRKDSFKDFSDFQAYCQPYSVFSEVELKEQYDSGNVFVIKMTYNAAFSKRINRKYLIDEIGLNPNIRWSFLNLSESQFSSILNAGGINESLIVNQT